MDEINKDQKLWKFTTPELKEKLDQKCPNLYKSEDNKQDLIDKLSFLQTLEKLEPSTKCKILSIESS